MTETTSSKQHLTLTKLLSTVRHMLGERELLFHPKRSYFVEPLFHAVSFNGRREYTVNQSTVDGKVKINQILHFILFR